MKDNALVVTPGAPPGMLEWRAVVRVLRSPGHGLRTALSNGFHDLVTTAFPDDCRICGGPLVRAGFAPVCDGCLSRIPPQSESLASALCGVCGEAMGMESARFAGQLADRLPGDGLRCAACRKVPPAFARAVAYGLYDDAMRELVHLLKYDRMEALAGSLGDRLAKAVLMLEGAAARELTVVAVPLFGANRLTRGYKKRGYNQSVLLADAAIRRMRRLRPGWTLKAEHGALKRVRETQSQFGLTPRERRQNLKDAFTVPDPALVAGREVLLIDDIYTTGATARECSRTLRRAGARQVWVATLARAQREQVAFWSSSGDEDD